LIFEILNEKQKRHFIEHWELDTSYSIKGFGRFRVNVFMQRRGLGGVFRIIPEDIKSAKDLQLPQMILDLIDVPRGLVLVTGPTGSGKSTTLAALLNEFNLSRSIHIVTLEDPVEFVHPQRKATFNQREMGTDFVSFASGLRAALRQAPKVILVGEMRDRETVEIGMSAAETGHLVLSTLHTINAGQTINRIIGMFDQSEEKQIRIRLAEPEVSGLDRG
jgi:twitching motility protein PilT